MDRTRSINSQDHCIALILNSNPTILSNLLKLQLPFIYLFPLTIFNLIIFAAVKPTFSAQIIIYFIFIYILEVSQKLFLVHIFIYVYIYNIHNTNTNILIMVKQIVLYFLQEVFFLIFFISCTSRSMFINERINSLRETNPEAAPDETPKDSASLNEFLSVWSQHSDLTRGPESRG